MTSKEEEAPQGLPELHGFGVSVVKSGVVDRGPAPIPGVVAKETRFSFPFLLDGRRGEHELHEVAYEFVGEDHPELVFDESSHFFAYEGSMLVGGVVTAAVEAVLLLLWGPRRRGGPCWDSFVAPLA